MKRCVNPPLASIFFGKGQTWFSVSSQHTPGGLAKAVVAMAREALESLGISSVFGLLGPESMCSPSCCQPSQSHAQKTAQHSASRIAARALGSSTFPAGGANATYRCTKKDAGILLHKKKGEESTTNPASTALLRASHVPRMTGSTERRNSCYARLLSDKSDHPPGPEDRESKPDDATSNEMPRSSAAQRPEAANNQKPIKTMPMTKEQLTRARQVFNNIDTDGSGTIDSKELTKALKLLGLRSTKSMAEKLIEEIDDNKNGTIEFCEFKRILSSKSVGTMQGTWMNIRQVFERLDSDKSGHLDKRELQEGLQLMGRKASAKDVKKLMRIFDADGNGTIEFEEFMEMMESDQIVKLPRTEVTVKELDLGLDLATYLNQKVGRANCNRKRGIVLKDFRATGRDLATYLREQAEDERNPKTRTGKLNWDLFAEAWVQREVAADYLSRGPEF